MNDSSLRDELDRKHADDETDRIAAIKRWVAYIEDNPADVWGPQQNRLVDAQLAAAQALDLDPAHYRQVREAGDSDE